MSVSPKTTRVALPVNQRGLLSAQDAAAFLSISHTAFKQIIAASDSIIKPRRIGPSIIRYRLSELEEYIASLPIGKGRCNVSE